MWAVKSNSFSTSALIRYTFVQDILEFIPQKRYRHLQTGVYFRSEKGTLIKTIFGTFFILTDALACKNSGMKQPIHANNLKQQ